MKTRLTAPFPYYGGKLKHSTEVWEKFGKPTVYIEPFAGSLAILLTNPNPAPKEIVCDTNGFICNFWRAIKNDPDKVAYYADYPTIHQDLLARHTWLRKWSKKHSHKLVNSPDYYNSKVAGWWVWGISIWIGDGWCTGQISDKRPHVHPTGGSGVSKQRTVIPSKSNDERLENWFRHLSNRLEKVVVLNRSWESSLSKVILSDTPTCSSTTVRCIFLDPPYKLEKRTSNNLYESDNDKSSNNIAKESYKWAVKNGKIKNYRIAYCCHKGDFQCPDGWSEIRSSFSGIRKIKNKDHRDVIFFSPECKNDGALF